MKVKSLSRFRLIVTPWTAAPQAPPPVGFSRPEHWSGRHRLLLSCYVSKFVAVNVDVKKVCIIRLLVHKMPFRSIQNFRRKHLCIFLSPLNTFFTFFCLFFLNVVIETIVLDH